MDLRLMFNFYSVEYRTKKGVKRSIVRATSEEDAKHKFYDPDDDFGPKYEIKTVTKARKIPKGWELVIQTQNDSVITVTSREDIDEYTLTFKAGLGNKLTDFRIYQLLCANPPRKQEVL